MRSCITSASARLADSRLTGCGSISYGFGHHSQGLANAQSCFETAFPESSIYRYIIERQHSDSDRAYLVVSHCYETLVTGEHSHHLALVYGLVDMGYGTRENPRMETQKAVLLATFEDYLFVIHCCKGVSLVMSDACCWG